jgi:hypothetical protein
MKDECRQDVLAFSLCELSTINCQLATLYPLLTHA